MYYNLSWVVQLYKQTQKQNAKTINMINLSSFISERELESYKMS